MNLDNLAPETAEAANIPDGDFELWNIARVCEKTSRSRASIYADPSFPKPIALSPRRVAWVSTHVLGWMRQRIRAAR